MLSGLLAGALVVGGASTLGMAFASQRHAPKPGASAAGTTGPLAERAAKRSGPPKGDGPSTGRPAAHPVPAARTSSVPRPPAVLGPTLARSDPVAITIPAIGVSSHLQDLGLAPTGAIAVPQPGPRYNEAAWYDGSPTPGEAGPSVIEGHIDSAATGPSVFFDLGALVPGDTVDVTLQDGTVAVFDVTGVRQYPKHAFPTALVYGNTDFAALRVITCGGAFDETTGHYLANTVVFAALASSHPAMQGASASQSGASRPGTSQAGTTERGTGNG